MTNISIELRDNLLRIVPPEVEAPRGDVVRWNTALPEGATVVPRQSGLWFVNGNTATPGVPVEAAASNTGYYQCDIYYPALGQRPGAARVEQQRVVAVLIVSEYKKGDKKLSGAEVPPKPV
jgi:hypothetical protein